jgi:hypothetical protein
MRLVIFRYIRQRQDIQTALSILTLGMISQSGLSIEK